MSQNHLMPSDFDRLHEAVLKCFESLAKKVQSWLPALSTIIGRTSTERLPLYSYITFEDKARPEIDPVVLAVDVRVDTGAILIQAHIVGEETGKGYYAAPKQELPFGTDCHVVLGQVGTAAQNLSDNTIPILRRVFGFVSPAAVPSGPAAGLPDVARKG